MILAFAKVVRVDVFTANFPNKRFEGVLQAVLAHVIKRQDFGGVCHEVSPNIIVDWDDDFAAQRFSHAQDVDGGHFVSDADGILAVGTKRHVDVIILTMLGKVNGVV